MEDKIEPKYNEHMECYHCKHKYNIPGDAHIGCKKYCAGNTFSQWGVSNGWVIIFPMLEICCYDPAWKMTFCEHFEEKE